MGRKPITRGRSRRRRRRGARHLFRQREISPAAQGLARHGSTRAAGFQRADSAHRHSRGKPRARLRVVAGKIRARAGASLRRECIPPQSSATMWCSAKMSRCSHIVVIEDGALHRCRYSVVGAHCYIGHGASRGSRLPACAARHGGRALRSSGAASSSTAARCFGSDGFGFELCRRTARQDSADRHRPDR